MILRFARSCWPFPAGVQDGADDQAYVGVVEPDECVAEVHRDAVGQAGSETKHPFLAP